MQPCWLKACAAQSPVGNLQTKAFCCTGWAHLLWLLHVLDAHAADDSIQGSILDVPPVWLHVEVAHKVGVELGILGQLHSDLAVKVCRSCKQPVVGFQQDRHG